MNQRLLPALASLVLGLSSAASAQQVVLDFDDLAGFAPMPAGYGGVADWGSWAHSDTVDPNYPPASGATRVFSVGLQRSIVFGQDVIFDGANVVTALDFSWEMSYQGSVVATSSVLSSNTGGPAVWLASGYAGLVDELRYVSAVNVYAADDFTYTIPVTSPGTNYCGPGAINSTGASGEISASGSAVASANDLTLIASSLPNNAFGFFITSQTQGFVANPNGSQGNLCLGGNIGRYVGSGQIKNSGTTGSFSLVLDLTQTPQPTGFVSVTAGETWNFQAWHRESIGGMPTSNFTDGLSIAFS